MSTYVFNSIKLTPEDKSEYKIESYRNLVDCFIRLSKQDCQEGKWTSIYKETNHDYHGNGCTYKTLEDLMEYIKLDSDCQINTRLPIPQISINDKPINLWLKL